MSKLHVVLADIDEEYIQRFTEYLRGSVYCHDVILRSYSHFEKFKYYLQHDHDRELLLVCEKWLPLLTEHASLESAPSQSISPPVTRPTEQLEIEGLVLLSAVHSKNLESAVPVIFKYQPLNELVIKLQHIDHKRQARTIHPNRSSEQSIVSLFSTVGGAGKTTAAINMVKQFSTLNKRVFYLNLEALSSLASFMPVSDDDEFAQLLYYAKTAAMPQLKATLQRSIKYDSLFGCDYLEPCRHYRDSKDLDADSVRLIIQLLQEEQRYDVIIIDLDSSLDDRIMGALTVSDHIIWLLTDDSTCILKTKNMLAVLQQLIATQWTETMDSIKFILTKYIGNVINDFTQEGIHITHYLPYIPQWKAVNNTEALHTSDMFRNSMAKLCHDLQLSRKEVAYG